MASLAIWHKFKDVCVSSELWDRLHRKPYTTRVSGLVNVSFLSLCRKKNVIYSVCPFLWYDYSHCGWFMIPTRCHWTWSWNEMCTAGSGEPMQANPSSRRSSFSYIGKSSLPNNEKLKRKYLTTVVFSYSKILKNNFLLGVIAINKLFLYFNSEWGIDFCFHSVFKRQQLIIIHNEFLKLSCFFIPKKGYVSRSTHLLNFGC